MLAQSQISNDEGVYKNYDMFEKQLQQALTLYPDSVRLEGLKESFIMNRNAITLALSTKINSLLEQGKYYEGGDDNLNILFDDLNFVQSKYTFAPNKKSSDKFIEVFEQSLNEHSITNISKLLTFGHRIFANNENIQVLLHLGEDVKDSIDQLVKYEQSFNSNPNITYPYEAAETFYKRDFDELITSLNAITNYKELIVIDKSIDKIALNVPQDFRPLLNIKNQLAASYLRYANVFMEKKYYKTAKRLIKRGNEIYQHINITQLRK